MKRILIIADGTIARTFLERIEDLDASDNIYHIVYYKESTLPSQKSDKFIYYAFDPTSFTKLSMLLEDIEFYQAMLVLGNKIDMIATYENIRKVSPILSVVIFDKWGIQFEDNNTTTVDVNERYANILSNYLPDIPLFAQNIGLGLGEIMEYKIPFGSAYVYRHVGNIEQKRWRIAAIFREQQIILPQPKTMLLPNDNILVVGNPNVLKGVYKSINRQFGQFPLPFGQNIYVILDMVEMSEKEIQKLCNDAMLLHANLNSKKLVFRILNPTYGKTLDKLKSYQQSTSMEIVLDFLSQELEDIVLQDITQYYIGLIITNKNFFKEHIDLLYLLHLPIFKIGDDGFLKIKHTVVLNRNSEKVEQLSSVIFDIASQLHIDISLIEFEPDMDDECIKIAEHFENLSKLFEEKVRIIKTKKNPIRTLMQQDDYLQLIVFDKKILKSGWLSFLSTNLEEQYVRFFDKPQLFLPYES